MGDSIGRPPAASSDDLLRPDAGFHDDRVGGQLKAEEAARRRAAEAKGAERPQRIIREPEHVVAASSFRPAREETPEAAQLRRQQALVAGAAASARPGPGKQGQRRELNRLGERVGVLMNALARSGIATAQPGGLPRADEAAEEGVAKAAGEGATPRRVEAIGEPPRRRQGGDEGDCAWVDEGAAQGEARGPQAWQEAVAKARFELQQLLAGGSGLALLGDPATTFAPILAKMPVWPASVPPGQLPVSAADFDAFVAWIFVPPDGADRIDPPL